MKWEGEGRGHTSENAPATDRAHNILYRVYC